MPLALPTNLRSTHLLVQRTAATGKELWTMHPDATRAVRIASTPANLASVGMLSLFSPDGKTVAYRSNNLQTTDPGEIWCLNTDGTNLRRVAQDGATMGDFGFSADSTSLYYPTTRVVQESPVPGRVDLASNRLEQGGAYKGVGGFFRTQDELLVINPNFDLFYEPFRGGKKTLLATIPAAGANLWKVVPAPDRSRLVLQYHYFSGSALDELWLLVPGGSFVRLDTLKAPSDLGDFLLAWSSDSRTLAYRIAGTVAAREGIYVLTSGSASPKRIVVGRDIPAFALAPDGSYLAYHRTGENALHLIRNDGTGDTTVPGFPGGLVADWAN